MKTKRFKSYIGLELEYKPLLITAYAYQHHQQAACGGGWSYITGSEIIIWVRKTC